jgi:hypothetical protein
MLAACMLVAVGAAAIAQTCFVTNEALTEFDDRDTFAGELVNDSGVDILQHRFRIAFVNANGAVVESFTVDGCLRSVQDGKSDFFSQRSNQPANVTEIGLARLANFDEDPDFTIGQVANGDIEITDAAAERDGDTLTVTGTITNNDNDTLEAPAVCAVVYNDDDRVVTTAKDTTIDDLDEGASAQFSIEFTVPDDDDDVARVDVWSDGLEDDVPVEPASDGNIDLTVVPTATPTETPTAMPTP